MTRLFQPRNVLVEEGADAHGLTSRILKNLHSVPVHGIMAESGLPAGHMPLDMDKENAG